MNKQLIYADAFPVPLVVRELSEDTLQFTTLDQGTVERIKTKVKAYGFGSFSSAPAWDGDAGNVRRAHLYVGWLFDPLEVAIYLAEIAQYEYVIMLREGEHKQGYEGIIGDSSTRYGKEK